jgi:hypothetical protein
MIERYREDGVTKAIITDFEGSNDSAISEINFEIYGDKRGGALIPTRVYGYFCQIVWNQKGERRCSTGFSRESFRNAFREADGDYRGRRK